uniref:Mediator of RNA polymerase II transcription subunit 21 n=1 Tax=Romanomermis culicivorax TaxID=13658 RepID=A0A915IEH1_ROMCU
MHFTPQVVGVPIDCLPAIAIDPQEAGPANPNPDADRLPPAPETSNQELAMQLHKLKGTVEALFDIIENAATEDNKREANSRQQELD